MTSKPNVIVVQKTTGKGATIQGLPGKNVVTTLLNAGVSRASPGNFLLSRKPQSDFYNIIVCVQGEKGLQAVQGTKPAIITATRPITKMIVTQPKGVASGSPSTATKIIPTKIVYGQQGKTQVGRQRCEGKHRCIGHINHWPCGSLSHAHSHKRVTDINASQACARHSNCEL